MEIITHLQEIGSHAIDQGLLNQAVGFFNAASRCLADVRISPLIHNSPMSPAVVCLSFSIELYLKLIHVLTTNSAPRIHKLDELFSALTPVAQQKLIAAYEVPGLAKQLADASSAFVDWRYEHEHESLAINPQVLIALATACHKVARELKPQLTVFGENQVINDSGKPSIEGTGADKLVSVGHVER